MRKVKVVCQIAVYIGKCRDGRKKIEANIIETDELVVRLRKTRSNEKVIVYKGTYLFYKVAICQKGNLLKHKYLYN